MTDENEEVTHEDTEEFFEKKENPLSPALEDDFIALLIQDPKYRKILQAAELEPEHIFEFANRWIFTEVRRAPTCDVDILKHELKKQFKEDRLSKEEGRKILHKIEQLRTKGLPPQRVDYIFQELSEFVGVRSATTAISETVGLLRKNKLTMEEFRKILTPALNKNFLLFEQGTDYFANPEILIPTIFKKTDDSDRRCPTPFSSLNECIHKGEGLGPGELFLYCSHSGGGKSIFLAQIANYAATVLNKKVIFYTLELSEDEISRRLTVLNSSIFGYRIENDILDQQQAISEVVHAKHLQLEKNQSTNLIVKYFPANDVSVEGINGHIENIRSSKKGWEKGPDLVLVDYVDLLKPSFRRGSRWEEIGETVRRLRTLAVQLSVPVFSASQFNRSAYNNEDPGAEALAGAMEKLNIADVVVFATFSKKDKALKLVNWKIEKNRAGPLEVIKGVKKEFEYFRFGIDLSEPEVVEEEVSKDEFADDE